MTPRTPTLPPTEPAMWKKLLARTHPDAGGSHELFIWTNALKETVVETATRPRYEAPRHEPTDTTDRVPFDPTVSFEFLTAVALETASEVGAPYDWLLRMLSECEELYDKPMVTQQSRGATYKQLAAVAHAAGMDKEQRSEWYRIAESVPLSVRHAGHLLKMLKGGEA